MDTTVIGKVETMKCAIADTTVIQAGDIVALSSGLIIKDTAAGTKIARAMVAHASGDGLSIEVSKGRVRLRMTAADVFAAAQRGVEYDNSIDSTQAKINQSATSTKVFQMAPDENAGTVGSASDVEVIINKPLDDRA